MIIGDGILMHSTEVEYQKFALPEGGWKYV